MKTSIIILIILEFVFFGCASSQKLEQAQQNIGLRAQIDQGQIDLQSVLDLGRSAYLKGCIDSKNVFIPEKTSVFETCLEMAKVYEDELRDILQ